MTTFYVFGESQNDTNALAELIRARAEKQEKHANVVVLRVPLIQQKSATPSKRKTNAERVEATVMARLKLKKTEAPVVIVAHEDCDDVEPAHTRVTEKITVGLKSLNFPIIAAAPAFEMEAWWYLWPEAVAAVCSSWKPLQRTNSNVGMIQNAKESLIKDLQVPGKNVRRYNESDAPSIAKKVRSLCIIDIRNAKSESFDEFDKKVSQNL